MLVNFVQRKSTVWVCDVSRLHCCRLGRRHYLGLSLHDHLFNSLGGRIRRDSDRWLRAHIAHWRNCWTVGLAVLVWKTNSVWGCGTVDWDSWGGHNWGRRLRNITFIFYIHRRWVCGSCYGCWGLFLIRKVSVDICIARRVWVVDRQRRRSYLSRLKIMLYTFNSLDAFDTFDGLWVSF